MKSIKNIFIAALILTLSVPAVADDFINGVLGSAIGAAAGSKIGKGNGRKAAIVAGALGGAFIGGNADQGTERRHRENLQMQKYAIDNQPVGYAGNAQRVVYEQVPQRQVVEYIEPAVQRRQVVQQRNSGCDEEYYNGEFDPEVAQAYCAGLIERQRQAINRSKKDKERAIRAAYAAGYNGQ